MFYVVGKTWCHNEPYETTVKDKYDDYETAKAAYDKLIREEENNHPQYKYKRTDRFICQDSKDENTIFTDNNNKTFLASIIYVSSTKSMLKLTPCDNTYNFTIHTPTNMFNYIEANQLKTF